MTERPQTDKDNQLADDEIIFFARCDRDKEEWFNFFREASLGINKTSRKLDKSSKNVPSANTSLSSMTENEAVDSKAILFINSLLSRVFVDFFIEKKFSEKIRQKFQNKLNKIRLPSFMEELVISEINLGSDLPKIVQIDETITNRKGRYQGHLEINT